MSNHKNLYYEGTFSTMFNIVTFCCLQNSEIATLVLVMKDVKAGPSYTPQTQLLLDIKWKELVKLMLLWRHNQSGNSYIRA